MDTTAPSLIFTLIAFILSISVLVFIHEWGHYIVARLCGVKIKSFSIGMGRELIGWTDKRGVRWKLSMLPVGGFVSFAGDASAASNPDHDALKGLSEAEKAQLIHFKPVWQRAAVAAAGPAINLIVPIFIYTGLVLWAGGYRVADPVVTDIAQDRAEALAALEVGDRITTIDGETIDRFQDIARQIQLKPNQTLLFTVERRGAELTFPLTVGSREIQDRFGNAYALGRLGITGPTSTVREATLGNAFFEGVRRTGQAIASIYEGVKQLILGLRSVTELSGPIGIADMTGQMASYGLPTLISFLALISINLGIVNLLPIPGLDGGHLMLYGIEAIKGSPLGDKIVERAYQGGFAFLMMFMAFVIWNDLQKMVL